MAQVIITLKDVPVDDKHSAVTMEVDFKHGPEGENFTPAKGVAMVMTKEAKRFMEGKGAKTEQFSSKEEAGLIESRIKSDLSKIFPGL
jgi:hypothetical protein